MIKRVLACLMLLIRPAFAVPVEVTSGEHDGFTRIVLNFGAQTDWEFGRVIDGYRFRPIGKTAEYGLKPVFDRIGKSRLAGISADPETSTLDIGFACACHAIPFEFRPGIIVIDLRDGPPPKGSSFENPLSLPVVTAEAVVKPDPKVSGLGTDGSLGPVYDWLQPYKSKSYADKELSDATSSALPTTAPQLQPLRDQLLRQLSRGATEGVIDLAVPGDDGPIPPKAKVDAARVALGELGGVAVKTVRSPEKPIGAEGAQCLPNSSLNILEWAESGDVPSLLSQDMTDLVGEFDTPQAEAVTRAARVRIFLGFGSEARLILSAFPGVAENAAMLTGLSYIVDGEADPTQSFAGQGRCTTAAALWAGLSDKMITQRNQLDTKSVILGFSGLPDPLRQAVGPNLIDRLLELGDQSSATTVRNIIKRANKEASSEVSLAEAKIDIAKGNPAAAESHLDKTQNGATQTAAESLVTRVKARIAQGLPVDKDTVTALAALQSEMVNTPLADDIAAAMIHANAASGDFTAAFAAIVDSPSEAAVVWRALATLADDSTLLNFAVPAPEINVPGLNAEDYAMIAGRLLDLGLPDAALAWSEIGLVQNGILLGKIHLARRDGNTALQSLEGLVDPEAIKLRATAYSLLGEHAGAAIQLKETSTDAQIKELARANDWENLSKIPGSPWAPLARDLTSTAEKPSKEVDTFGPLVRGLELAAQSKATRAEIEKLMLSIANPASQTAAP